MHTTKEELDLNYGLQPKSVEKDTAFYLGMELIKTSTMVLVFPGVLVSVDEYRNKLHSLSGALEYCFSNDCIQPRIKDAMTSALINGFDIETKSDFDLVRIVRDLAQKFRGINSPNHPDAKTLIRLSGQYFNYLEPDFI